MSSGCCGGDTSCASTPVEVSGSGCPTCGRVGKTVARTTVSALTRGLVAPHQDFRLCREPACPTVYYGSLGSLFGVNDMHVVPGFKEGSEGWVCYCYHHSLRSLERELRETGESTVVAEITAEVQAGNCACDVRNPTGKCCLGEVQRALRHLAQETSQTAAG